MRRFAVAVAFGLLAVVAALPAGAQDPDLVVTPTSGLMNGDRVDFVAPSGWTLYAASQCNDPVLGGLCVRDPATDAVVGTSPSGSYTVRRFVETETREVFDCALVECYLTVSGLDGFPPQSAETYAAPLEFAAVDAMWIGRGEPGRQRVVATFFDLPDDAAAWVMRCAGREGVIVCGDVGTIASAPFDGVFQGTAPSGGTLTLADGSTVPCPERGCKVGVVVVAGDFVVERVVAQTSR